MTKDIRTLAGKATKPIENAVFNVLNHFMTQSEFETFIKMQRPAVLKAYAKHSSNN